MNAEESTSHNAGNPFRRYLYTCFVALIAVLAFFVLREDARQPADPGIRAGHDHVWADESTCIDCHTEAESFWETGHANTLRPAVSKESLALLTALGDDQHVQGEGTRIHYNADEGFVTAVNEYNNVKSEVMLDWCFGSGHHACTWVATLTDGRGASDLLEFRWSSYEHGKFVDVTPGQPLKRGDGHLEGLGMLHDPSKARQCFSCHATQLTVEQGYIDSQSIRAGVTCQKCHGARQRHVETDGQETGLSWKSVSQQEAINRCAECHRRANEQDPKDVTPQNADIVRFQPVGLVQSKCFNASSMTCTTCHDPHRTLSAQKSRGIWQCIQCHSSESDAHTSCAAGHVDDCLQCHMPAIRMESPLTFTDHWIRVRNDPGPQE
ncbi:MAG: multiheme c-type cytochrome [Planctomycetaceae bacterium]